MTQESQLLLCLEAPARRRRLYLPEGMDASVVAPEGAKIILLTRGKVTLVDEQDYESLSKFTWHCTNNGYAARRLRDWEDTENSLVLMHRVILKVPIGKYADHIDMNTLNNRRSNLRICTNSQNMFNSLHKKPNIVGFKGITIDTRPFRKQLTYRVQIYINGKNTTVGYFTDLKLAKQAYLETAKKHHGEFARVS